MVKLFLHSCGMPKRLLIPSILLLLFIAYIVFQSRAFLFSPRLSLSTPEIIRATIGQEIHVEGFAPLSSRVSINGQDIALDREGKFSQSLVIQKDTSAVEIRVANRFGKENVKTIKVSSSQ